MHQPTSAPTIVSHLPTLDILLHQWRSQLGKDHEAYRNHVYRVVNHCLCYASTHNLTLSQIDIEKIAIAGAFHDIGIWLDNTFDYLGPSEQRANNYLVREGKSHWVNPIIRMISEHHKLTQCDAEEHSFAEMFRQADWIDVSMGMITFALPRSQVRLIRKAFPYVGFHKRLIQLSLANSLKSPLKPLPMFKW